jgi:hypothetical protein
MDTSTRAFVFAEPAPAVSDRRWGALRRAARARLAPFGAAVLLAAIVVALAAPLLSPYDPLAQDLGNVLARPGRAHWLGTDNVGRDVLSRVIWGTRVSLVAGFVSVAIAAVAGGVLGMLAGYAGGRAGQQSARPRLPGTRDGVHAQRSSRSSTPSSAATTVSSSVRPASVARHARTASRVSAAR